MNGRLALIAAGAAALLLVGSVAYSQAQDATRSRSFNVPVESMEWRRQTPDVPLMVTDLWGDRQSDGGFGELVQLPPGFDSRLHAHSGDFHGVLIKGIWVHEGPSGEGGTQRLLPGSYVRQAGAEMHVDRCVSEEPCVLFLFQYARADIIWPEARK